MTGLFAALGFSTPWLLWALLALPVIWILLRVVPPAAVLRRFPGVVLLLGLADTETAAARTPPWLLMLRILALALVILGFAGPVLNPDARAPGVGPVLI
ncbi:MAG: BatA domain-containing protein, partial [Albidovulum sp.]